MSVVHVKYFEPANLFCGQYKTILFLTYHKLFLKSIYLFNYVENQERSTFAPIDQMKYQFPHHFRQQRSPRNEIIFELLTLVNSY